MRELVRLEINVATIAATRGVSRAAIARRAGCSRSHLQEVLAGRRSVGIDLVSAFGWELEVKCAAFFRDPDVSPFFTCALLDAREDVRRILATNFRTVTIERYGSLDVAAVAAASGWHPSCVYALLARRFSLCIDKLHTLATGLGTTACVLLRS